MPIITSSDVVKSSPVRVQPVTIGRGSEQVYEAAAGTANALHDVAIKERAKDEIAEGEGLIAEYSKRQREILHGTPDKEGFYAKKGINATDGYADTQAQLDALRAEFAAKGSSDRVKALIAPGIARRTERAAETTAVHVQAQRQVARDAASIALQEEAVNDAAANYNDPVAISRANITVKEQALKRAVNAGLGLEAQNMAIEKASTDLHLAVINAKLPTDPSAAKEYFEKNKKEILGTQRDDIEKTLTAGVTAQRGQENADKIMAMFPDNETKGLEAARKIKDPQDRDEAVKRIKIRYAEEKRATTEAEKEMRKSAWQVILDGGTPNDLTPAQLSASGLQITSMWSSAENIAKRGQPYALVSDPKVLESVGAMDNGELLELDTDSLRSSVSSTDHAKIVNRKNIAIKAQKNLEEDPNAGADINRAIKDFAPKSWDVGQKAASKDDRVKVNAVRDEMYVWSEKFVEENKRKPSDQEVRKEASRLLLDMSFDSPELTTFDKDGLVFEIDDEDLTEFITDTKDISIATGIPEKAIMPLYEALQNLPGGGREIPTINTLRRAWQVHLRNLNEKTRSK